MDLPEILTRPPPTREDELLPDTRVVRVALIRLAITALSFGAVCFGQNRFPLKVVLVAPLPIGMVLGAWQSRRGALRKERALIGLLSAYHLVGTLGLGLVFWQNLRRPLYAMGAPLLMIISGRLFFGDEASLTTDDSTRFADRDRRVTKRQIYTRWKRAQVHAGSPLTQIVTYSFP